MGATIPKRSRGRPRLAERVERLSISLPAQVVELIDEQARREGMTRPDWVRAALMRAVLRWQQDRTTAGTPTRPAVDLASLGGEAARG